MSKRDLLLKILLPFLILVVAAVITLGLVKSRKMPQQEEREVLGPLVKVMQVATGQREIHVSGTGTVQPRREVGITPQVSGQIVEISPTMVVGGFFREGDLLFAIEDIDYQLALERARANLALAELELAKIAGQAEIARFEWQRLELPDKQEPNPLVVFEPQMKSAEAQRASAAAAVAQAKLNLQRTRIAAPFNCYVRSEHVDVGQYVKSGSSVATIAGTDKAEIIVSLPLEELEWLQIPGQGGSQAGSSAEVMLEVGTQVYPWQGRVNRVLGDIDPRNRMASLVISVADPFGQRNAMQAAGPDLAPGTFVRVLVKGSLLDKITAIPRLALHDDDTVWVVDAEDKLRMRKVEIVRRERDEILVSAGLEEGERIVLTNLSGAADGMRLRPQVSEARQ